MRLALRLWHFFTGHPAKDVWAISDADWPEAYECEGCGKIGERL